MSELASESSSVRPAVRRWGLTAAGCVALTVAALGTAAPRAQAQTDPVAAESGLVERGRDLYATGCSSCHGADGKGQRAPNGDTRGPSLVDKGEASAFYVLSTGRMPLANSGEAPVRKEPAYSPAEIEALVAYVGTLGNGPGIPDVDPPAGDLAEGGELYREQCQACHSATGAGGALSYGRAAPSLGQATALEIGAAMRAGPGQMPVFGPDQLDQEQIDSVARYVRYLENPDDRGGVALGRLGPIPEGFLIWVLGIGLLLVVAYWVGHRRTSMAYVDPEPPAEGDE